MKIIVNVIYFFLAVNAILLAEESPVEKNAIMINCSLGIGSLGGELYYQGSDESSLLILGDIDYKHFIWNRIALGGRFNVGYFDYYDDNLSMLAIGPTLSFYFGKYTGKFFPYVQISFMHGRMMLNGMIVDQEDVLSNCYGIGIGLTHLVSKNVGITSEIGYEYQETDYDESGKFSENRVDARLGLGVFIY